MLLVQVSYLVQTLYNPADLTSLQDRLQTVLTRVKVRKYYEIYEVNEIHAIESKISHLQVTRRHDDLLQPKMNSGPSLLTLQIFIAYAPQPNCHINALDLMW